MKRGVASEDEGEGPDERVDADLGEEPREDRRHRDRRRVVRGGQPEEEREDGGLDAEGDEEEAGERRDEPRGGAALHGEGEVGHVERARDAVEDTDRGEEDGRGEEVERHVLDGALELCPLPPEGEQHERGHEHDLERHVEVEQVPGEERHAHAHQEDVEERVVAVGLPRRVDRAERVDGHRQAGDAGEQHHDRGEEVGHEADPVRGGPRPRLHDLDAGGVHPVEERGRHREQQAARPATLTARWAARKGRRARQAIAVARGTSTGRTTRAFTSRWTASRRGRRCRSPGGRA